jgi:peptidoglycan/LPS O-acetylase OafA/YrhL
MYRFGPNLLLWLLAGFAWCYTLTVLADRVAEHTAPASRGGSPSWGMSAALLTAFLVLLALAGPGPLSHLRWRWLVYAGALTYPFYLVHQSLGIPVVHGILKAAPALGLLPSITLGLLCSLLLSAALHHLVDRPGGRLLRRHLVRALDPGRRREAIARQAPITDDHGPAAPSDADGAERVERIVDTASHPGGPGASAESLRPPGVRAGERLRGHRA